MEYELRLLNFIIVERTTFRDILSLPIPSNLGGRKKLNKSFLRRVSFLQPSFFSENILKD